MSAKNFAICAKAIIHLLLHNLHDCTFKSVKAETFIFRKFARNIEFHLLKQEVKSKNALDVRTF